jgi:hypothetical protein
MIAIRPTINPTPLNSTTAKNSLVKILDGSFIVMALVTGKAAAIVGGMSGSSQPPQAVRKYENADTPGTCDLNELRLLD